MFRLTFLGTSAGMPTTHRYVSGIAVEMFHLSQSKVNPWILVDCGEGMQYQLLKTPLKLNQLKAICITHLHGDHCYGLAGLLASMSMQRREQPLVLIAPRALIKLLDVYTLVTDLTFSYPIDFIAIEELECPFYLTISEGRRLEIDVTVLSHRMPSYAFGLNYHWCYDVLDYGRLFAEEIPKNKWHAYAKNRAEYRIAVQGNEKLVVAGDNDNPDLLAMAVQGAKALVHECTYTQVVLDNIKAKGAFDPQHTTAKAIAQFAQKVQLPMLILTHFSARYAIFDDENSPRANMGHIRAEVEQYYQGKYILAEDLLGVVLK